MSDEDNLLSIGDREVFGSNCHQSPSPSRNQELFDMRFLFLDAGLS